MDDAEQSMWEADRPEDVERFLRYIGQRMLGQDPERPILACSALSKHDMLIVSGIITSVVRRELPDAASALQFEADLIALLASVGVTDMHRSRS